MKKRTKTLLLSLAMAAIGCQAFAQGVILWNESVNGELSQDSSHPTSLTPLMGGTNSVLGATEVVPFGGGWVGYGEFFTIAVPSGLEVSAIYLTVDSQRVWHWIGDTAFLNQLGWIQSPTNGDLLPQWGLSSISAGVYGLDIENHNVQ